MSPIFLIIIIVIIVILVVVVVVLVVVLHVLDNGFIVLQQRKELERPKPTPRPPELSHTHQSRLIKLTNWKYLRLLLGLRDLLGLGFGGFDDRSGRHFLGAGEDCELLETRER